MPAKGGPKAVPCYLDLDVMRPTFGLVTTTIAKGLSYTLEFSEWWKIRAETSLNPQLGHLPLGLCSISETIDITNCDNPEWTPQAPSDILVVKLLVAPVSSNFRPLTSKDPIEPTYKSNKSLKKEPSNSIATAPQFTFRLLELSKFERPLAILELSFLSTSTVISPSLDPALIQLSPISLLLQTLLSDNDRAYLCTLCTNLAHLLKSYQKVTCEDRSLE
ncbi:hypothetical protein GH714_007475 [Hevea brasiliensis]|uniref:Uncharacterized protein n=1 Tax=Hevea brasiliensis TaxID=3981 RepID=A0A6A6LHP9_HEVBR|nr:hypothetical protein GH714_007475 [Hevea brasiliensis]